MEWQRGHYKAWDVSATEAKLQGILRVAALREAAEAGREIREYSRLIERARLARVRARDGRASRSC